MPKIIVVVTDGSSLALSACQKPSLTYVALTARADYAVFELKELLKHQGEFNMNRRDAILRAAMLFRGTFVGSEVFLACKPASDHREEI